ncbi:hypothetical protein [Nocardia vermiculata]|uniref:DUF8176 domain-containing protein n=1 Tax=Nocardia vermiculata TaxID=257274 RepID=A0A846Y9P2_9NOCA|nr:hypothetical protein [Nocardia vermiculata]NKY53948.1 hypothetical protein [Nocardia vermiculata]
MVQESQRWRQWLDNAAVPAPTSTDTRRRKLRRQASTASSATPAAKESRKGSRGRRVLVGGVAAIAVVTTVGVAAGLSSRPGITDSAHPYEIVTTEAANPNADTTSAPPAFCTPGRVGGALVSNSGGDQTTGEGAVAEYEFRYFGRRDPAAVMEITDNGPGVPGPAQVAAGIASIPADAPWCVSVTPAGENRYETSVRYQPNPSETPVSWLMVITVAPGDDGYRVVRIEDKTA